MLTVIETPVFLRYAAKLLAPKEHEALIEWLPSIPMLAM